MDRDTADLLVQIAEEARVAARQRRPGATAPVEDRYREMQEALDWYLDAGEPEAAYRLASALVPHWVSTKRIDDGDAWFERALGSSPSSGACRARALHDHGYLVFWAGRYDLSERRLSDSLALAEQVGDPSLQALALAGLARVALNRDVHEAVRLLRQAVDVTGGLPDNDLGRSGALHVLGVALQMSGDLKAARGVMTARLSAGRAHGDESVVWVESANLSMVERQLGNLERAEEYALQALKIDASRGDEMSLAWTVNSVAAVTAAKGDYERAATLNGMAAAMLEHAGGQWPPDERKQYDETLAAVTAALPPDGLAAARERGAAMSLTDGVAFALGAD